MARMIFEANQLTAPAWCGDYGDREHLMPGGGRLNPADFTADAQGRKLVLSGTLIGRTIAERDANAGFGPWTAGDEDVYLLWQDVTDAALNADADLYRPGSLVKENYLPGTPTAPQLAVIRAKYHATRGVR